MPVVYCATWERENFSHKSQINYVKKTICEANERTEIKRRQCRMETICFSDFCLIVCARENVIDFFLSNRIESNRIGGANNRFTFCGRIKNAIEDRKKSENFFDKGISPIGELINDSRRNLSNWR